MSCGHDMIIAVMKLLTGVVDLHSQHSNRHRGRAHKVPLVPDDGCLDREIFFLKWYCPYETYNAPVDGSTPMNICPVLISLGSYISKRIDYALGECG